MHAPTEQIAIWILMALKEEWEHDPSHSTGRTESVVLGPLKSKHNIEDADISRGIRFLASRRMLQAVNREDGRATPPSPVGLEYLAAHIAQHLASNKVEPSRPSKTSYSLSVFVSHSAKDETLAKALVELLRSALNIPANEIRCTSVNGYRLSAGASIDDQLRQEVHESQAFIGLITPSSMASTFVLFELGARWGADCHLVPLLGGGADASFLRGPLGTLNALSCDDAGQIHQLVDDLASLLAATDKTAPAGYQAYVERLIGASKPGEVKPSVQNPTATLADPGKLEHVLSDEELRVMKLLVNTRKEGVPKETLIADLGLHRLKVDYLIDQLTERKLLDMSLPKGHYCLTTKGRDYLVENHLL